MRKTFFYALAGALVITGVAETTPLSAAERASSGPRTLEQLREQVRPEALTSLALGHVETVRHRRGHRRRYYAPRRYSMRYVHRRGRWCGRGAYYGRRCYYTPRVLRPFRQR